MATFVLVHGSWAGSVVWRELAPRLRKAGHDVYAPTLTGAGERTILIEPVAARSASCHRAGRGLVGSTDTLGELRLQTSRGDRALEG